MDEGLDDLFDVFSEPATSKRKVVPTEEKEEVSKRAKTEAEEESTDEIKSSKEKKKDPNEQFAEYVDQRVEKKYAGDERKSCMIEVCYPPNYDFEKGRKELVPRPPAKEYPFELDPFQKQAVECIEREESVLVSAHTSAGKTVVAEYAIATALRDGQRVIYTSPIKALSNQKYRELYEEFNDVGLMTGDITINPSASCLVMTTEILRNMLYRGSEVMREISWVVFDEVHYMNNKSRGVVWEETMILLPDKVKYAFLSATIPNSQEFALWIAKLHNQPCSVIYTDYRPTPLQHYVFPAGGDGLYLVVDDKGNFRENNFSKALSIVSDQAGEADGQSGKGKKRHKKNKNGPSDIFKIVKMIMDRKYQPAIVFSFSKRDVENNALQMSELDFCTPDEKKLIGEIFNNAIDSLSEDDRSLPQVGNILPLLTRGIGVHHGGLLPILKEVIEILFQEGLLKVLFSTETFAMGLNMPARTVVFTAVHKWDGEAFRTVSPGEYIQMSGRAGRRGLDDRGIVIMMVDEELDPPVAKNMIQGAADPLNSSFHLGYNMLLNLLRVEEADPEFMMVRSFFQFQSNRNAPKLMDQLEKLKADKQNIVLKKPKELVEYHQTQSQLTTCRKKIREVVNQPINLLPFLNPGRLVLVEDDKVQWGWGIIVNFSKLKVPGKATPSMQHMVSAGDEMVAGYVVDVLLKCKVSNGKGKGKDQVVPCKEGEKGEMQIVPVLLPLLAKLSTLRLYIPPDLKTKANRNKMGAKMEELHRRFPAKIPTLDPVADMKIKDDSFLKLLRKLETLEDRLNSHPLHGSDDLKEQLELYNHRLSIDEQCMGLRTQIKNATQDVVLRQTLKGMKRVLRRLGFTTADNVIDLKGRVACEISTSDELLATELMFSGLFNDLAPELLVSLCSCLVFEERSDDKVTVKAELAGPLRQLQETARRIGQIKLDSKLPVDVEEYAAKFQPQMMDIVLAWCRGSKFSDICKMTDIFEGSIIRVMRRLEELLRQLACAAKVIGNEQLEKKFTEGRTLLKRDIVFAASLYL